MTYDLKTNVMGYQSNLRSSYKDISQAENGKLDSTMLG